MPRKKMKPSRFSKTREKKREPPWYKSSFMNVHEGAHERSWTFINVHKCSWIIMNCSWTFMNVHERQRFFGYYPENVYKRSWTFRNVHERLWTFMNVHKRSWIVHQSFINVHEHTYIKYSQLTFQNMFIWSCNMNVHERS